MFDVRLIGDALQAMSLAPGVFPVPVQSGQFFRCFIERDEPAQSIGSILRLQGLCRVAEPKEFFIPGDAQGRLR